MVEFRFTAEKLNGQTLIGSLTAVSSLEGKKKITRLAEKNQLKIRNIEKKSTFLYRVRKGKDQSNSASTASRLPSSLAFKKLSNSEVICSSISTNCLLESSATCFTRSPRW